MGRLTLRPGLRYEQQELVGGDPPLCHENDSRPGLGDGTGELVHCRFKFDNNWAPRLGATYDVLGNGRSKVFASWGRFYARVPNDLASRSLSADAGISRADYFDQDLTRPVPEGVLAGGQTRHFILAGTAAAEFDPDAKMTYLDEFLGGIEFEALTNMSLGVRYIHRNMPRILEDVGTAQMVLYDLGVPGLESVEYFITNVNADTRVFPVPAGSGIAQAHFEDPVHKYNAVEVTFDKRWRTTGRSSAPTAGRSSKATSRGSSAATAGSPTRRSRRSSTSRPTIRATRRLACRSSGTAVTSASSGARLVVARCPTTARTR